MAYPVTSSAYPIAASLFRLPKHGNEWTRTELNAYNINVTPQDIPSFFGLPSGTLPQAQVPADVAEFLNIQEAADMANEDNAMLINLLDAAMVPPTSSNLEESAVIDFTVQLFKHLGGYVGRRRHIRTGRHLPLPMGTMTKIAAIDLCIVDSSNDQIVLLVQEDKRHGNPSDAEAKLISKAIAAFMYNNECRRASGLPELQQKVSLVPSFCYFVRLLITSILGDAWDRHDWNYANVLSNSCHCGFRLQSSPWTISRPAHWSLSFSRTRCEPEPWRHETIGQ